MLCILYVIAVGVGLGSVGLLAERSLPAAWPRRAVWALVIALSVGVPAVYRLHHTAPVGGAAGPLPALDPLWWGRVDRYDGMVHPFWELASAGLVAWALLAAGWATYAVRRSLRRTPAPNTPAGAAVVDGVPVVLTDALGPATVGVLRPRVLLPRWVLALPAAQRRYVVRHEDEHRRAHDARLLFAASLTLIVAPWNLALWWHLRRLQLAVETDCDRRVVRALGDARAYAGLLLRVGEAASRGPRLQPALLGRAGMLERRLTTLLRAEGRGGVRRMAYAVLATALLAGVLALPHPVVAHPSHTASPAASPAAPAS